MSGVTSDDFQSVSGFLGHRSAWCEGGSRTDPSV